jgi:glycyl-tRNA synthetase beta chain
MKAALLIEIGCEEIPARMIVRAADDLGSRVTAILDNAGLDHGAARSWGGSRRLIVHIEDPGEAPAGSSSTSRTSRPRRKTA